jgi:hypothetical protein
MIICAQAREVREAIDNEIKAGAEINAREGQDLHAVAIPARFSTSCVARVSNLQRGVNEDSAQDLGTM